MLKNILNLKGAQQLSKNAQEVIRGGLSAKPPFIGSACLSVCPSNCEAIGGKCEPCIDGPIVGFECRIY